MGIRATLEGARRYSVKPDPRASYIYRQGEIGSNSTRTRRVRERELKTGFLLLLRLGVAHHHFPTNSLRVKSADVYHSLSYDERNRLRALAPQTATGGERPYTEDATCRSAPLE